MKLGELKKYLTLIAEGYFSSALNDRFIVIENPDFSPGGPHDPFFVIDIDDLGLLDGQDDPQNI